MDIPLEEAYAGCKKTITVPRHEVCGNCRGSGAKPGTKRSTCPQCKGAGQVAMSSGFFRMVQTCSRCAGTGEIVSAPCPECHGEGRVKVTRKLEVKIPAGVDSDSQMRLRGEGEQGKNSTGDLYLLINVQEHPFFKRRDNDIICEIDISLIKAVLGGEVEVPTLNGNVSMRIPAGTQPGKIFRLRDKGMPDVHAGGAGDELVRVNVVIPASLNSQQRKLLEEFARFSGEDVDEKQSFSEKIKKAFR